jgi:hypothetical protein
MHCATLDSAKAAVIPLVHERGGEEPFKVTVKELRRRTGKSRVEIGRSRAKGTNVASA